MQESQTVQPESDGNGLGRITRAFADGFCNETC